MLCSLVVGCAVGSNAHKPRLSPGVLAEQARLNQAEQTQSSRDVVVEANPDQIDTASDIDLSQDPDLPLQDLDAETLEQL